MGSSAHQCLSTGADDTHERLPNPSKPITTRNEKEDKTRNVARKDNVTLPRDKKKSSYELISTLEPRTGNHILHSNWEGRPNILPAQDRAPERAVLTMAATHRPRPHMSLCQSWVVKKHQQHERIGQCYPIIIATPSSNLLSSSRLPQEGTQAAGTSSNVSPTARPPAHPLPAIWQPQLQAL